jgi:ubiquinone/menaquinone biosynthesis C-methylase UbiE
LFLDNGNRVVMVEPNDEIRQAGELLLSGYGYLESVAATVDTTRLPQNSKDFITVGQAFHWFDPVAAREEFTRVLRPGGTAVLVWNARRKAGKPFLEEYEGLLNVSSRRTRSTRQPSITPRSLITMA